jgi:chitin disaccharide deacetylase
MPSIVETAEGRAAAMQLVTHGVDPCCTGLLIVNADDWGREPATTDRITECIAQGTVSSVSAMVFMVDSERAAAIAREQNICAGLHLNFTTAFSGQVHSVLLKKQQTLSRYLLRHPFARAMFHPGLADCFKYVVAAQLDEFRRLYGSDPERIDGHHHMHLSANVLLSGLIPPGVMVRPHFSFEPREKRVRNSLFRWITQSLVARRYCSVEYFFSLPPLHPSDRLERIFRLARRAVVELETHPVNQEEYQFLSGGEFLRHVSKHAVTVA